MTLVIVESPTKSKSIAKFLGKGYEVLSSYGHVRDLPKSELGIDIEKNFKPKYIIPTKARKKVKALKDAAKKTDLVILATDEDREGAAIAWHILQVLELEKNKKEYQRIVFHEITEKAIKEAIDNPRKIDIDLVNAQQARRMLDRLVGYKLSPFLWKKVLKGLSAGRVQSVAVRLIVDREREREAFKSEEYWSIEIEFKKGKDVFRALLAKKNKKSLDKFDIRNKEEADDISEELKEGKYQIEKIDYKETKRNPYAPFTTSTLQQEGSKKLRFSAKQTMRLAQKLYEGVKIGKQGLTGLITYHRTDSLNLSKDAVEATRQYIKSKFGNSYLPEAPRFYKTKSKGAQEAHEAIRPTHVELSPEEVERYLDPAQFKLYSLIWKRFVACQMNSALLDTIDCEISADCKKNKYLLNAHGATLKFDGFLKVYPMKLQETIMPKLKKKEILDLSKVIPEQHFTQPPARYSEALLIKHLEKHGIGRPSTYAPIISTIQDRRYVEKDEVRKFMPTEMGYIVTDILKEHFEEIVDVKFTALMERDLDKVAQGKKDYTKLLKDFYTPFAKNLKAKYDSVEKKNFDEPTDKICPDCGSNMIIKMGRFGKFYACPKFPECKHAEPIIKSTDVMCPECKKGEIIERKTRRGKTFYSCSKYPKCKFALWDKPTSEKCPQCNSILVENKKGLKCSNKDCDYLKINEDS